MFLEKFPTEVTLLAVSRLPLASIIALGRTCTAWRDFIHQNVNSVYRSAAFVEGYIAKSDASLSELTSDSSGGHANSEGPFSRKAIQGVNNWEDLCKRYKEIRRSWLGHGPSRLVPSPLNLSSRAPFNVPTGDHHKRIYRFKVDEQLGLLLATTKRGGLIVKDLDTDEVLWELPQVYVHGNAYLEYERGYIVFDRIDGGIEVWRRTEDVQAETAKPLSARASPANGTALKPTRAQLEVVRVLNSSAARTPASPKAAAARFSPVCVLTLPRPPGGYLPRHLRPMYRLLFPSLLVVRVKTAYVVDITTGKVTQTIDDIHRVHKVGVPEFGTERDEELPGVSEGAQLNTPENTQPPLEDADDDDDGDVSDSDDWQDAIFEHPSLDVRGSRTIVSVDLSPRNILVLWRDDLLVFSRRTGICVLKMDSRMMRHGMWRWDLMPLYKNADGSANPDCTIPERDSYRVARAEGREVVPMPMQLNIETEMPKASGKKLHDRFGSAQFSRDGRNLAVLLSGSRLVVVRDFEAVLVRHRIPPPSMDNIINTFLRLKQGNNNPDSTQFNPEIFKQLDEEERVERLARDRDLFANTLEVQLGSPRKSNGIHLAYAHGRIGVVTSDAVYVVTPPPHLGLNGPATSDLKVVRVPYFVSPSWLGAVGSLVLSDTGLYLNWNTGCQIGVPKRGGGVQMTGQGAALVHMTGAHSSFKLVQYNIWDVESNTLGWSLPDIDEAHTLPPINPPAHPPHAAGDAGHNFRAVCERDTPLSDSSDDEVDDHPEAVDARTFALRREEKYRRIWERDYLRDLREMKPQNMDELYLRLPGPRGWIVTHGDRCLEVPHESTVFAVQFAPPVSSRINPSVKA